MSNSLDNLFGNRTDLDGEGGTNGFALMVGKEPLLESCSIHGGTDSIEQKA